MTAPADAIALVSETLDRALMARDPDGAARQFTEDAILGESGMDDVVGRAAILRFLQQGDAVRTVTHHRIHRDELHLFDGWAVELGWFDETKVRHGETPVSERGRTMTLWRRDADEAWRIHRLVISDLPATASPSHA